MLKQVFFLSDAKRRCLEASLETKSRASNGISVEFPYGSFKNRLGHISVAGFDVYSFSTVGADKIVLYVHGGSWVMGIDSNHTAFCNQLAEMLNAVVYLPQYPLGPEYSPCDTYAMLLALYDELLKSGKPVYIMGDSAGGTVALELAAFIRDSNRKMPAKLVLISPVVDPSLSNPESVAIENSDPILSVSGLRKCAEMWAKSLPLTNPAVCPNNADLHGLPDTLIFIGTADILYPDVLILADHMANAECKVQLVVGEDLFHVFPFSFTSERDYCFELIRRWCPC